MPNISLKKCIQSDHLKILFNINVVLYYLIVVLYNGMLILIIVYIIIQTVKNKFQEAYAMCDILGHALGIAYC